MDAMSLKDFNLIMGTENPANKFAFQWSIRNINKIPRVVSSSKFSLVSGQPAEWDVSIERESCDSCAFVLSYHAHKDAVPIFVSASSSILKNGISVLRREELSRYIFRGGSQLYLLDGVKFPDSGKNDVLVFQCSMTVHGYGLVCSRSLYNDDGGRDVEELKNDYLRMLKFEELADVIIIVEDRHFTAHKCVLKSLAPKFFSANQREISSGKFFLTGILPDVFEVVLQSIYSGEVYQPAIVTRFQFFYTMAVKYDLLQRACTREMIYNMKNNVCKFYKLAEDNKDVEGKNYCEAFMKDNLRELECDVNYRKFSTIRPHLPQCTYKKPYYVEDDYVISMKKMAT